jgi:hypothetical protein
MRLLRETFSLRSVLPVLIAGLKNKVNGFKVGFLEGGDRDYRSAEHSTGSHAVAAVGTGLGKRSEWIQSKAVD